MIISLNNKKTKQIMKLKTKTLLKALNQIDFDKSKYNPLNLLSIQIVKNAGRLKLSYSDDIGRVISILIDCQQIDIDDDIDDIDINVDFEKFTKLVKTIKSDIITLEYNKRSELKINNYYLQGDLSYSFNNLLESLEYKKILQISSDQFVKMINQVKPAIEKDKSYYDTNSININSDNNKLNLIATDGKIMILKTQDIDIQEINEIIPDCAVKQIIKAFKNNELLTISIHNEKCRKIKIESNDIIFYSQLNDGKFPDVKKYSYLTNYEVKINKKELIETTKEALAISTSSHNRTIFNFQDNILEIKVMEQHEVKYSNQINIDGVINEIIHLNAKLLLNILKSIDDDIFILKIKDKISTVVIEANNFMALISPLSQ